MAQIDCPSGPVRGEEAFRALDLAIADQCRINVLWLHGDPGGQRALEIAVPELSLSGALASLYRQVERLDCASQEFPAASTRLPFQDGAFDVVTLYGRCPARELMSEVRRVLQLGGTAMLAAQNRWWHGRLRRGAPRSPGDFASLGLEEVARSVGFREVRAYWVEPSLANPRNLVPTRGHRVSEFEAMRAREWGSGVVRSMAVAARLDAVLYPALLIVAKA